MDPRPQPMISIIIPVFNVADFLPRCLDSVLADPAPDIEVIAVDDASPDASGAVLDERAATDGRLRVVHLSENAGLGGARNAGLDRARGEYVWFVDADDWLPEGSVDAVRRRLAAQRPDVLVVDHEEVFPDGRTVRGAYGEALREPTAPIGLADRPELLKLAQSACTKVVRRDFLRRIGLRFSPGWYEDCSYSHPLLMAARSIDLLDRVCYCYRQRADTGAITKTPSPRHFEVFDQYERLFTLVENAAPAYDRYRPILFRLMIDHYLVIVGNERRVPAPLRRAFFDRMVRDHRRWLPAQGYPVPGGLAGLKHRLVGRGDYSAYAALRAGYRAARRLRSVAPRT
ncbi:glycosyltransferase family 2 protein [Micromonospora siamensis]|uniref:Glycosyltransferase involved in cell wall bisynthesis n=1 Tax=Micromonospora siamensis TaxID=299152 RepID=A0A1C5HGR7_9ACTN|nr:glycosyltransferase family 2 protein [Micromonospora siamensis]SCG45164.1 Glycosyltransferase involved in cell wall bisynthesis [Micromonospora siamensis]